MNLVQASVNIVLVDKREIILLPVACQKRTEDFSRLGVINTLQEEK